MPLIGTRSDSGKVLLGCARRGPETVGNYPHDGLVPPGVAGCLNSDGEFIAGASTPLLGISRGVSMVHPDRNSVTQRGKEVPLGLTDLSAYASASIGTLVFVAKQLGLPGNDLTIALTDGEAAGSETVAVVGGDIVIGMSDEVSTAAQIKAAVDGDEDASALVGVTIVGAGSVAQASASETSLAGGYNAHDYVVPGGTVHIGEDSGLATESGTDTVASNWFYDSSVLEGVYPTGSSTTACALVNM